MRRQRRAERNQTPVDGEQPKNGKREKRVKKSSCHYPQRIVFDHFGCPLCRFSYEKCENICSTRPITDHFFFCSLWPFEWWNRIAQIAQILKTIGMHRLSFRAWLDGNLRSNRFTYRQTDSDTMIDSMGASRYLFWIDEKRRNTKTVNTIQQNG